MKQYKFSSLLNVIFFIFMTIFISVTSYLYFDLVGRINNITKFNNNELIKLTNEMFKSCFSHKKAYFDSFVSHSPIHTCLDLDIDSQLQSVISRSSFGIVIKKRNGQIFHNTTLNKVFIDYISNVSEIETFYLLDTKNLYYIYRQNIEHDHDNDHDNDNDHYHKKNPHVIYYVMNIKYVCNINQYFNLNNILLLYNDNDRFVNVLNGEDITINHMKLNENFNVQFKNSFINIILKRFEYYYYFYISFICIICVFFSKYIYVKLYKSIEKLEHYCDQEPNVDFLKNFQQTNLVEIDNLALSFQNLIKYIYKKEEQYRLIVESIYDVVWLCDMDLNFKYITPSSAKIFDTTPKKSLEILNDADKFVSLYNEKDLLILMSMYQSIYDHKLDLPATIKLKQFNFVAQKPMWVSITVNEVKKDNERVGLIGITRDIDIQEKSKLELRKSENRYRLFIENFQGIAFQSNVNKKFIFLHGTVEKITGYQEKDFIKQKITWCKITHDDDLEKILIRTNKLKDSEDDSSDDRKYRIVRKDGTIKWIREFIYKLTIDDVDLFQGIVIDVTKQKLMEDLVNRSKRMSYLGTMAAGIAHEINNPLTALLQYGELLLDEFDDHTENFEILNDMIYNSQRIAKIVKTLLTYSKTGSDLIINNINDIISNAILFSKDRSERYKVEIKIEFDEQYFILCNKNLIEQIFINLINNSIDAINENENNLNRIIQIKLEKNNNMINILFKDSGIGMDEKTKDSIFIPFHTTKDPDKGTGLGMSLTQTFIFDNNGTIEVESEEGKYTLFNISFPIYEDS